MRYLAVVAVLAVLGLGGCAATQTQIDQAYSTAAACRKAIIDKPEYASLLPRTFSGTPPMTELTNETIPTAEEARLLQLRFDEGIKCQDILISMMSKVRPDVVPILTRNYSESQKRVALLAQRKITWAENARQYQATTQATREMLTVEDQRMNEINAAQRQAAAAVLLGIQQQNMMNQALQQQNMLNLQNNLARINAANQPVTVAPFTCMAMGGGMVSCH